MYAVRVRLRNLWHGGVANIGVRPTVNPADDRLLEVHIFEFSGDCYGEDVDVEFAAFLRPEKKFRSIEALKDQIARDAAEASRLLGAP